MNSDNLELVSLVKKAMTLGLVLRSAKLPNGEQESSTDHSVMVTWIACSAAARWYPHLDRGLIAQLSVVHDAVEIYAGDTHTVGLSHEGYLDKKRREQAAHERLITDLQEFSWLPDMITRYEARDTAEARLVWAVDKLVPKIVHLIDGYREISRRNTREERIDFLVKEDEVMKREAADFPEIQELRELLIRLSGLRDK